jgi:hypothetical protein
MFKHSQVCRSSLSAPPRRMAATLMRVGWGGSIAALLAALLAVPGLAGCGQKGALVLPPPEPAASAPR